MTLETTQVWLAGFTTSKEAKTRGTELFQHLGFSAHHQLARLAIGRSLGESDWPAPAPDAQGFNIKGNLLFGDEKEGGLLWIALLVENIHRHQPAGKGITLEALQSAVRDHWHRGVGLLHEDWETAPNGYSDFVETLITRRAVLPDEGGSLEGKTGDLADAQPMIAKPLWLDLGTNKDANAPARWLLNGQGYSPNVAIMGQAGSGKTRMMLKLLAQLRELTGVPVLLIDAGKDELAERADLARELGAEVIRVPASPVPLDMFHGSTQSDEDALVTTEAFRESLNKALQSGLTDNQKTRVLEAVKPLFRQREKVLLPDIRTAIDAAYEAGGTKPDRVNSIMTELCQRTLFMPDMSPQEFFSRSWILTFGNASEESRRLVLFLLFDALHRYLRGLAEAPVDDGHHRAVRLALAIDEARPLLAARHDGLSNLVRLHRSKGLTVFMASQSPDDYEGQSDDYMEQIGLPVCFKTNATSTAVLNNMFKARRGLNFATLEPGVCLTVLDGTAIRVVAF
jgi:hypothetical protein